MLGNQHQQPVRVLLQWRDASATRLRCRAAVIMPAPEPVDHRTRAHFKKHGHLVSRGATLDDRYRSRPQVVRIRLGHPTILPKGIRGTRLAHPQTFGNPPDSRPLGYALAGAIAPCVTNGSMNGLGRIAMSNASPALIRSLSTPAVA